MLKRGELLQGSYCSICHSGADDEPWTRGRWYEHAHHTLKLHVQLVLLSGACQSLGYGNLSLRPDVLSWVVSETIH
jgi:hypothetical protein